MISPLTRLGKVRHDVDVTAAGMRITVPHYDFQGLGQLGEVAGHRVAHLEGRVIEDCKI